MCERFSGSMITVAITASAAIVSGAMTQTAAQALLPPYASPQAGQGREGGAPPPALKTPGGEPDRQGIWTDESDTPLQRPAKYAAQEFFTAAQRAELDEARAAVLGRDRRAGRGGGNEVPGGDNTAVSAL